MAEENQQSIITNTLADLARCRRDLAYETAALTRMIQEFEARPEVLGLRERIKSLKNLEAIATTSIKLLGAELHSAGATLPDGIKTRGTTVVTIDEVKALAWANINMPVAVIHSIDEKMLKDYAKKHPGVDWAKIDDTDQITIASDLSKYLEE